MRPDLISVPQAAAFTGFAYLYMSLCFYLFFAGLILLFTMVHDLWGIERASDRRRGATLRHGAGEAGLRIMRGIFRCTIAGTLIAICMKIQSIYVTTAAPSVWHWLVRDMRSVLPNSGYEIGWGGYSMPTHYTSLLVAMATGVVFLYGTLRIRLEGRPRGSLVKMAVAVAFLVFAYLAIGAFAGFSILLGLGIILALYGLFDPGFGTRRAGALEDNRSVP